MLFGELGRLGVFGLLGMLVFMIVFLVRWVIFNRVLLIFGELLGWILVEVGCWLGWMGLVVIENVWFKRWLCLMFLGGCVIKLRCFILIKNVFDVGMD